MSFDPRDAEIASLKAEIAAHREADDDRRALVRELDVALNGEKGAAKQASLCDIVSQVKSGHYRLTRFPPTVMSAPFIYPED